MSEALLLQRIRQVIEIVKDFSLHGPLLGDVSLLFIGFLPIRLIHSEEEALFLDLRGVVGDDLDAEVGGVVETEELDSERDLLAVNIKELSLMLD